MVSDPKDPSSQRRMRGRWKRLVVYLRVVGESHMLESAAADATIGPAGSACSSRLFRDPPPRGARPLRSSTRTSLRTKTSPCRQPGIFLHPARTVPVETG